MQRCELPVEGHRARKIDREYDRDNDTSPKERICVGEREASSQHRDAPDIEPQSEHGQLTTPLDTTGSLGNADLVDRLAVVGLERKEPRDEQIRPHSGKQARSGSKHDTVQKVRRLR